VQSQTETRDVGSERNFKSVCGQERLEDVAHDVYLVLLVSLELLPDDRIVEHVEFVRSELAEHFERLTVIEYEHLIVRRHRHRVTWTDNHSPVWPQHLQYIALHKYVGFLKHFDNTRQHALIFPPA